MPIVKRHGALVKVIAKFLNKTGFKDKRFRTEDLGVVFNLISQARYNDGITIEVDGQLINSSFKLDEAIANGGYQSVLPLADLLDSYDKNNKTVLLVEKTREMREDGRYANRITTIGVFRTVRIAEQVSEVTPILKWDVHHTVVKSLVDWLEGESTWCKNRSKSKRKVRPEVESSSKKAQKISPASKESILNRLTLEERKKIKFLTLRCTILEGKF